MCGWIEDGTYIDLADFVGELTSSSVLPVQVETLDAYNYFDAGEFQKGKNLPQKRQRVLSYCWRASFQGSFQVIYMYIDV